MEKSILKHKKGQISDIAFVLITLVSIGITFLVAGYIYSQIDTAFEDSGLESNESAKAFDDFEAGFSIFDKGFAFILIGLIIGLLISSFAIPTHPIFLVINVIGFLVLVFLGATFSNLYVDMISQPGFQATADAFFPVTVFIMTKLPFVGAILVLLSTIIMYSKSKGDGY